ncbi:helix-turn-helix domain-containing protein [Leucothrix mucor]|uniref:helix-turn-helix domain-containing protein n=1 Tax=Leucothrix mucor TaxID=45248 RepID=UPI0003B6D662|nr:helix-turn-helix domain-containing protein [Leucothrix mucor]
MANPKHEAHSCSHCSLSDICLPLGIDKNDLDRLEKLVQGSHIQHDGDVVIQQGTPFTKIFAVKSGMYKSTKLNADGHETITGFHLPGELIGLDAIYPMEYTSSTTALTTSALCQLDYDQLTDLSAHIPALQKQLIRLISKEINNSNALLSELSAEQKLASFIRNLAIRYETRGYSGSELILAMTRQDIANHLGMAAETVSRLLKRFQDKGVLKINHREVKILNPEQLLILTGCEVQTQNIDTSKLHKG